MNAPGDAEEPRPAIQTCGLRKTYGRIVGITDLDLSVRQGEILGFLGPNGAGKTTTIRLLLGLIKPSRGSVHLLGRALRRHAPGLLRDVGYLPGELGLYGDLSGHAYLLHLLRLRAGGHASHETLQQLERRFDIDYTRPIRGYSKGMKQVVGIIQAFAHDPRLVILDEPTSGLDPLRQESFYELIRACRARGTTVFFSSHVLREVERVCDRVALVRAGRLVSVEDVSEYRARVGKRVRVTAASGAQPLCSTLRGLPGAGDVRLRSNDEVELQWSGPVQPLLRALASLELADFHCEDPDIEDFFFHAYREPGEGR
jgi:ABC-2 type transport system ATP-binding protein